MWFFSITQSLNPMCTRRKLKTQPIKFFRFVRSFLTKICCQFVAFVVCTIFLHIILYVRSFTVHLQVYMCVGARTKRSKSLHVKNFIQQRSVCRPIRINAWIYKHTHTHTFSESYRWMANELRNNIIVARISIQTLPLRYSHLYTRRSVRASSIVFSKDTVDSLCVNVCVHAYILCDETDP